MKKKLLKIRHLEEKRTLFINWDCHHLYDCYLVSATYEQNKSFSIFSVVFKATMRFFHFTIILCIFSFSLQSGSCGFLGDAIRQGFQTTIGFIKDLPKRIPTPNDVFELGKNVLIGFPLELTIGVVHEVCKYSTFALSLSIHTFDFRIYCLRRGGN